MRLRFETVYRGFLGCLLAVLVLSIWSRAADAPVTASTNRPVVTNFVSPLSQTLNITNAPWLTFGLDKIEVLQVDAFAHRPLWQFVALTLYILLAFAMTKAIDFLVAGQLRRWAAKTESKVDDLLIDLISGPLKIISFVILLKIGLEIFTFTGKLADYLGKGLAIIVACSLTYVALRCVDVLVVYWLSRVAQDRDRAFDEQLTPIIRKGLKVFVVVVAVLTTSATLGMDITSALASLSIGGLALGLAAQDTLANLFGAVSVFLDKPFRLGDRIKLGEVDGVVEQIGLRSTRVRSMDGFLITVPNKTMGNASITNLSQRPSIRTEMNFGLVYDLSSEKMQQALDILQKIYTSDPKTCDLIMSFNKFVDSALNIYVVHWYKSNDVREHFAALQNFNLEIKRQFDAHGIEFAFPSQTHYVKTIEPAPPARPA